VAAQDGTQRLGDLAGGQRAGRDLVQQRLEQVEVAPVHEREPDAAVADETPGRVEAAEPAPDDDNVMGLARAGRG
jgi:hypothetical protein